MIVRLGIDDVDAPYADLTRITRIDPNVCQTEHDLSVGIQCIERYLFDIRYSPRCSRSQLLRFLPLAATGRTTTVGSKLSIFILQCNGLLFEPLLSDL